MASAYPIGKDELVTNQTVVDGTSIPEAYRINKLNEAVDAMQTNVGV